MNVITVALYVSSLGIFINSMHSFICDSIHKKKRTNFTEERKRSYPLHTVAKDLEDHLAQPFIPHRYFPTKPHLVVLHLNAS